MPGGDIGGEKTRYYQTANLPHHPYAASEGNKSILEYLCVAVTYCAHAVER